MKRKRLAIVLCMAGIVMCCIGCQKTETEVSQKIEESVTQKGATPPEEDAVTEKTTAEETVAETPTPEETKVEETTPEAAAVALNHTYTTKFSEVNAITFPDFSFDYSDNWTVTSEEVTQLSEVVTLTNASGATVQFSHYSYGTDYNFGGSSVSAYCADISKAADSRFVPGYVQAEDYSSLGTFMVARVKVIKEMDMRNDTEYIPVDGTVSYAVLPESDIGEKNDLTGIDSIEYSFSYASTISFVGRPVPGGEFTPEEEQEVIAILASFRVGE